MAKSKKTQYKGVYSERLKNDVSFKIKFYTPDGQHFTLRVGREKRDKMTAIRAERIRQEYIEGKELPPGYKPKPGSGSSMKPRTDRPTFNNLAKLYWQIREKAARKGKASKKAVADDKSRFEKHVAPTFGNLTPEEVTIGLIREFAEGTAFNGKIVGGKRDELSDATVDKLTGLLTWIDNATAELTEHRQMSFKMPKYQTQKDRKKIAQTIDAELTVDAFVKLMKTAKDLLSDRVEKIHRAAMLVYLAGNIGNRNRGLTSLRWENIDLKAGTFTLSGSVIKSGGHVFQMNDNARDALRYRWERELKPRSGWVFPSLKTGVSGHWTRTSAYIWEIYERANLGHLRGRIRPLHGIRHRAAKILIDKNVPLKKVQAFMAHDSIAATLIYTDVDEQGKRDSVDVLNGMI